MFDIQDMGPIVRITMQHAPVNAISNEFVQRFNRVLDDLEGRPDLAVLHIRSGQKAFCAGADLAEVEARFRLGEGAANAMVRDIREFHRLFDRIENLPCITLAEIGGTAFGGGFELALSTDLRIAAYEARMGLPEARLGLIPGAGGTQRLTRLCGPGVAARIILACDTVDGAEACRLGLVQWAVPADELEAVAQAWVQRISGLSLPSLRVSKRCIARVGALDRAGYEAELQGTHGLMALDETRQRVHAFFEQRQ